ncbi:MAG: histidine-type phosphatase [Bacteroides sp.]|nr:histidine-type phosphatase [Bacteroides sp.]
MKTLLPLLLLSLCLSPLFAQTGSRPTNEQLGSVYLAYPTPAGKLTPAPRGYRPVYISHYGRHGSRWMTNDVRYLQVKGILDSLYLAGELTELGKDVRLRIHKVWQDAEGKSGSITPLGERQMQEIAGRMYVACPELFSGRAVVDARSSTSLRCAMSMSYFTERLKELNPRLRVSRRAYHGYMDYIAHTDAEGEAFSAEDALWRKSLFSEFEARKVRPERLMASLFKRPEAVSDPVDLMRSFFWIAADMQNVELKGVSFYDLFTYEELYGVWETVNARMYVCNANAPLAGSLMVGQARNLLRNIVESADAVLEGRDETKAHLRFGHDTHLIRLLALMQVEGCCTSESDIEKFDEAWRDFRVSPMGANLQLIFFRNKTGHVLVKFLLNENEVHLPLPAVSRVFYDWEEVKKKMTGDEHAQ